MASDFHCTYLGLGSNLGNREEILRKAVELLANKVGPVVKQSSTVETEPWGFESAHPFLNAVVCCHTRLTPRQLLQATQQIEKQLGKQRRHATQRRPQTSADGKQAAATQYHDRPIDIDILLYDDLQLDEPDLKIPHPLMEQRDFVMRPLNEITDNQQTTK